MLADWARERPDLDFSPVGVIARLARVRSHIDEELASVFGRYALSPADFQVVVALRRAGEPYRLPQARLMTRLALTSGTVSVRVDRLLRGGIVVREADPGDARVALVRLTRAGLALFDKITPVHLANEDRLLSALDGADRDQLAGLLRRLLVSFEHGTVQTTRLGLQLEPAHVARARRIAVGLSDVAGLLVSETTPGSPAATAGVARGDLLIAVGTTPVQDAAALQQALAGTTTTVLVRLLRGDDELQLELAVPAS